MYLFPSKTYPGHLFGGSYPSAEKQSVYSSAPADWASLKWKPSDIIQINNSESTIYYLCYILTFDSMLVMDF